MAINIGGADGRRGPFSGVIGGRPEVGGIPRYPTGIIGGRPEISGAYDYLRQLYSGTGIIGGRPEAGGIGRQSQYWPSMDAEIAAWVDELLGKTTGFTQPAGFGGGGGGGGAGGGGIEDMPAPRFTLADIMANLQFPGQWQYPSYLRDFGRYLEELITQNPQFAVPTPEFGDEGVIVPTPEDLETLDYMETAETYAVAWNKFLQLLTGMPFYDQQSYVGLRYTPETDWYRTGVVPMLPHPEYL